MSDRKSDSGRQSGGELGVDTPGHRLMLGRADRGSWELFLSPFSFLHPSMARGSSVRSDRGQNDSRWAFYEPLALERRAINLKQLRGITMRDRFMPLPSSDGKHAHVQVDHMGESCTIRASASGTATKENNQFLWFRGWARRNLNCRPKQDPAHQDIRKRKQTHCSSALAIFKLELISELVECGVVQYQKDSPRQLEGRW